jgi:hypothetical protein
MNRGMKGLGSLVALAMVIVCEGACGGAAKDAPPAASAAPASSSAPAETTAAATPSSGAAAPSTATTASGAPAGSSAPAATGDSSAPAAPAPQAHPFAKNAEEATSLIDDAINAKAVGLTACVDAARARRKDKHARIVVTVGIDEDGHMIGVELPKGEKKDKALTDCLLDALRDAPFPKSHAGVITVKRTFEDKTVYR